MFKTLKFLNMDLTGYAGTSFSLTFPCQFTWQESAYAYTQTGERLESQGDMPWTSGDCLFGYRLFRMPIRGSENPRSVKKKTHLNIKLWCKHLSKNQQYFFLRRLRDYSKFFLFTSTAIPPCPILKQEMRFCPRGHHRRLLPFS